MAFTCLIWGSDEAPTGPAGTSEFGLSSRVMTPCCEMTFRAHSIHRSSGNRVLRLPQLLLLETAGNVGPKSRRREREETVCRGRFADSQPLAFQGVPPLDCPGTLLETGEGDLDA